MTASIQKIKEENHRPNPNPNPNPNPSPSPSPSPSPYSLNHMINSYRELLSIG
jgi:hypothetical protein